MKTHRCLYNCISSWWGKITKYKGWSYLQNLFDGWTRNEGIVGISIRGLFCLWIQVTPWLRSVLIKLWILFETPWLQFNSGWSTPYTTELATVNGFQVKLLQRRGSRQALQKKQVLTSFYSNSSSTILEMQLNVPIDCSNSWYLRRMPKIRSTLKQTV